MKRREKSFAGSNFYPSDLDEGEFDEVGSEGDHGNDSTDIQDTDWSTGTAPLYHPSQLGSNFVPSPYLIVLLPMPAPFSYRSPPLT